MLFLWAFCCVCNEPFSKTAVNTFQNIGMCLCFDIYLKIVKFKGYCLFTSFVSLPFLHRSIGKSPRFSTITRTSPVSVTFITRITIEDQERFEPAMCTITRIVVNLQYLSIRKRWNGTENWNVHCHNLLINRDKLI